MNNKAQSNMFWIIIGAVIALIVMIILLLLFTGKTDILEDGVSGCEGKSGQCVEAEEDDVKPCGSNRLEAPFDCKVGYVCCIGFSDGEDK